MRLLARLKRTVNQPQSAEKEVCLTLEMARRWRENAVQPPRDNFLALTQKRKLLSTLNTTEHNKTRFQGFENEYKDLRTLPPEATSQFCQSRNDYCPQSLNLGQAVLCIPVHSFQEAKVIGFGVSDRGSCSWQI